MNVRLFVTLFFAFLAVDTLPAQTIIGTDFANTNANGTTLEGVTYSTTGVTVASGSSDLTVNNTNLATGNGDLITTDQADGFFAVNNNTGNGGEWSFTIDFTTGSDAIDLTDFTFDFQNFNGGGAFQNALRDTEITFDLVDVSSGSSVFSGGPLVDNTPVVNTSPSGLGGSQTDEFDLTGTTLAANTTFQIFVQAGDATTAGNNFGFDSITLNGNVVESTAVPEPGTAVVLGLAGLAACLRRRK